MSLDMFPDSAIDYIIKGELDKDDLEDFKEWFKSDFPNEAENVDELDVLIEDDDGTNPA